jgi:hypothetical protein
MEEKEQVRRELKFSQTIVNLRLWFDLIFKECYSVLRVTFQVNISNLPDSRHYQDSFNRNFQLHLHLAFPSNLITLPHKLYPFIFPSINTRVFNYFHIRSL